MPRYPKAVGRLARQARRAADRERCRDIFMRTIAVEKDPDGKHLWLLLKPRDDTAGPDDTVH